MRQSLIACCLLLFASLFYSCTTDFDINGDNEEIMVVYGLINQTDTTHFVKITKTFLGEGSAYDLAKDPSLSSYGDDIDVKVYEMSDGNVNRTFSLTKTMITNKDTGIFYAPNQEVYSFSAMPLLNESKTLKIEINNKVTGSLTTASTTLIKNFNVSKPAYNYLNPLISFVKNSGEYLSAELEFETAKNGRIYECFFRFNYTEINKTTSEIQKKFIDWKIGQEKASTLDGSENKKLTYNGESFFKLLQNKIPVDNNLDRIIGKIELHIDVGSDDLSIYIDLNKPSSSIVQERPLYTNVSNGIGIFTSRYSKVITFNFSTYTIDKLLESDYTQNLGFKE
jgi:hypothetical protein